MAHSTYQVVMICCLLLTANTASAWEWPEAAGCQPIYVSVSDMVWNVAVPVGGGVAAVAAAPVVLTAAGFGAGGVAAGTVGAKLMSAAWSTGVGVGTVAGLQSAGAAGLTLAQSVVVGSVGAGITKFFTIGSSEKEACEQEGK